MSRWTAHHWLSLLLVRLYAVLVHPIFLATAASVIIHAVLSLYHAARQRQ